jgi:hypothetical protein
MRQRKPGLFIVDAANLRRWKGAKRGIQRLRHHAGQVDFEFEVKAGQNLLRVSTKPVFARS